MGCLCRPPEAFLSGSPLGASRQEKPRFPRSVAGLAFEVFHASGLRGARGKGRRRLSQKAVRPFPVTGFDTRPVVLGGSRTTAPGTPASGLWLPVLGRFNQHHGDTVRILPGRLPSQTNGSFRLWVAVTLPPCSRPPACHIWGDRAVPPPSGFQPKETLVSLGPNLPPLCADTPAHRWSVRLGCACTWELSASREPVPVGSREHTARVRRRRGRAALTWEPGVRGLAHAPR